MLIYMLLCTYTMRTDTWQVRMKALCVLEAVLKFGRRGEAYTAFFKAYPMCLQANAENTQPNVRAKAMKCLGKYSSMNVSDVVR